MLGRRVSPFHSGRGQCVCMWVWVCVGMCGNRSQSPGSNSSFRQQGSAAAAVVVLGERLLRNAALDSEQKDSWRSCAHSWTESLGWWGGPAQGHPEVRATGWDPNSLFLSLALSQSPRGQFEGLRTAGDLGPVEDLVVPRTYCVTLAGRHPI